MDHTLFYTLILVKKVPVKNINKSARSIFYLDLHSDCTYSACQDQKQVIFSDKLMKIYKTKNKIVK